MFYRRTEKKKTEGFMHVKQSLSQSHNPIPKVDFYLILLLFFEMSS